jgi:hypothetical protein
VVVEDRHRATLNERPELLKRVHNRKAFLLYGLPILLTFAELLGAVGDDTAFQGAVLPRAPLIKAASKAAF